MTHMLVAAGTTEGRQLCEYFAAHNQKVVAFVATEYGQEALPESPWVIIETGRKDKDEMAEYLKDQGIEICFDATHPYAAAVSANLREACRETGCRYQRIIREDEAVKAGDHIVLTGSISAAADYLKQKSGNILVTTGSKELRPFTEIQGYQSRIFVRVLPSISSLEACREAGIAMKQVIAMQGPFSTEMNRLILREKQISWLVTKNSGAAGGFQEKLAAAKEEGAGVIVVRRPAEEEGMTLRELIAVLQEKKK